MSPTARAGRTGTRTRSSAEAPTSRRTRQRPVPPILVRELRDGFEASVHRGDVVQVDGAGRVVRALGDPNRPVLLGTCGTPFAAIALVDAGGIEAFELAPTEVALMAGSHAGEDLHVRTLQAVFRRANLSQGLLACGAAGMPLDALTASRLARDGERPGAIRHTCSGEHAALILLSKLRDWDLETYWQPEHPAIAARSSVIARVLGAEPGRLEVALDACGLPSVIVPLHEVARLYAFLAEPSLVAAPDPRASMTAALLVIRDAMLDNPELVGGTRDQLDTSLMKAAPRRLISRTGPEGLQAVALLGSSDERPGARPSGLAIKIEDGGGHPRAGWAASVEALHQVGVLDGQGLRMLARFHSPATRDSQGRTVSTASASFELAPVGELIQ